MAISGPAAPLRKPAHGTIILNYGTSTEGSLFAAGLSGQTPAAEFEIKCQGFDLDFTTVLEDATGDNDSNGPVFEPNTLSYGVFTIQGGMEAAGAFDLSILRTQLAANGTGAMAMTFRAATDAFFGPWTVVLDRVLVRYRYSRSMVACTIRGRVTDTLIPAVATTLPA